VPRNGLGNFAVAMNVVRKVTTITILQNKVNSILSLQPTEHSRAVIIAMKEQCLTQSDPGMQKQVIPRSPRKGE